MTSQLGLKLKLPPEKTSQNVSFQCSRFIKRPLWHFVNVSFSLAAIFNPGEVSALLSPKDFSLCDVQMKHLHAEGTLAV